MAEYPGYPQPCGSGAAGRITAQIRYMPRLCAIDPLLPSLLRAQDWVLHRSQALRAGFTPPAIDHRISSAQWQPLLPSVYLAHPGEPSRRQMLIAAQLYTGDRCAIDAADACRYHGIKAVAVDESVVHVVEPWGEAARSTGFVVVRRTLAPMAIVTSERLRFVDAATAVIAATRGMQSDRQVLAALSDALQRRVTSYDDLVCAHIQGSPRNARRADNALASLAAGARSAPEADFLHLASASVVLPTPICNATLRLPGGRLVSPDALFIDAGLVHETNGRNSHGREDLFDDMQERHDAMTSVGLTVLHNSPRRLSRHGREVIAQVERCYARLAGRGLPEGVELIRLAS
jgi:hypothetical protein